MERENMKLTLFFIILVANLTINLTLTPSLIRTLKMTSRQVKKPSYILHIKIYGPWPDIKISTF